MPVDITRFDFNVHAFMNSESVDAMSSSEIGQYLLLLVKSWAIGKGCTLPDDPAYLARHARVDTVSDRVLEKFPVVETDSGPRRRNETLYLEWEAANLRCEQGRAFVARRGGKWADSVAETDENPARRSVLIGSHTKNADSEKVPSSLLLPNPTQPNQPNQPKPINPTQTSNTPTVPSDHESEKQNLGGEWRNIAVKHKRIFSTQASTAHKGNYAAACDKYSEDVVLECFDDWSADAKDWVKENGVKQPLFAFWKKLPDMAETIMAAKAEEKQEHEQAVKVEQKKQTEQAHADASVVRQAAANWKRLTTAPPPENGASVLEYLPELADAKG